MPPVLPHLTFLLTEHCNLQCRSCGHFSPLAAEQFADLEMFRRDLARLAELITVENFWLMGGEPLLHAAPGAFMRAVRENFQDSRIWLTTNGVLLPRMDADFWRACEESRVTIEVSAYPPLRKQLPRIRALCASHRVPVTIKEVSSFTSWMNLRGDSDPAESFRRCKLLENSVPLLRNSRLQVCSVIGTVGHLNRRFNAGVPELPGLDLFDPSLTAEKIQAFLSEPTPACRFCAHSYSQSAWGQGLPELGDWNTFEKTTT